MYSFLKRILDIAASAVGLMVLLPVGLLIAVLIKLMDGGPVFFGQTRIGKGGRPFRMWKFRSMVVDAEKRGLQVTQGQDPRITRIGRILRRTKLDELPQLWNVLVGEMSLVGPRPEVPRYVELYTPEQRAILGLKPGITDLATVLFRNEEELLRGAANAEDFYIRYCLSRKIDLNLDYARRASFAGDLWIILQTIVPYWIGVLLFYAFMLLGSLWFTFELLSDFQMSAREWHEFRRVWPCMVLPQLACLLWQGQARGLLSYFSVPELKRTALALSTATLLQAVLCHGFMGQEAPKASVFLMGLGMAFFAVCGVRMGLRLVREGSTHRAVTNLTGVRRVGIVGTSDMATSLCVHLMRRRTPPTQVVAFFEDDPRKWRMRPHDVPVVGMPECLLNFDWSSRLDEVIVAIPGDRSPRVQEIVALVESAGLKATVVTTWPLPVALGGRKPVHGEEGDPPKTSNQVWADRDG